MSFLIRLALDSFLEGLPAGSTVYVASYVETVDTKEEAVVLLTSNGGTDGGPIHVVRMRFEPTETEEGRASVTDKVKELLSLRGLTWSKGILLSVGLNEALRDYIYTEFHTPQQLDRWIAETKRKETKESK